MKAYKHLVMFAIAKRCTVSVWDGEAYQVKRSRDYRAICAAVESVEEAELTIRDALGAKVCFVTVQPFGVEDDETVSNYEVCPFMNEWEALQRTHASNLLFA